MAWICRLCCEAKSKPFEHNLSGPGLNDRLHHGAGSGGGTDRGSEKGSSWDLGSTSRSVDLSPNGANRSVKFTDLCKM